jgi:prevent-host-death family protein
MTRPGALQVGVYEAKTTFSRLLERVAAGEEVVITRRGEEVARLVPPAGRRTRRLGLDRGLLTVPDDFDSPLDDATLATFER